MLQTQQFVGCIVYFEFMMIYYILYEMNDNVNNKSCFWRKKVTANNQTYIMCCLLILPEGFRKEIIKFWCLITILYIMSKIFIYSETASVA
jgi:hypothetical protein